MKESELKQIIKEIASDAAMLDQHQTAMEAKIPKKLGEGQWEFSVDRFSGTWEWSNKKLNRVMYATAFWNGEEMLPIEVLDYNTGDPIVDHMAIRFKPTFDVAQDVKRYLKIVRDLIRKLKM